MDVIGAGFGRTGTASLKEALELLGFGPCYHMFDVVERPERMRAWVEAAETGGTDWDAVFEGYASAVDWPASAFWRELAGHYPAAKVVLTVRDAEGWYDSAAGTIFRQALKEPGRLGRAGRRVLSRLSPDFGWFLRMTETAVLERVFHGRIADREYALRRFAEHIDQVRATLPPERLLTFRVADGWEPLCEFLGVEVPPVPFPRGNDRTSFAREDRRRMSRLILGRG